MAAGQRPLTAQNLPQHFYNHRRLRQPADSFCPRGQIAGCRFDHCDPPIPKRLQILLGGRVLPHVGFHGRRDHHGPFHRQKGGAHRVIRQAVGQLGQRIGRQRRNQHDIRAPGQRHMVNP